MNISQETLLYIFTHCEICSKSVLKFLNYRLNSLDQGCLFSSGSRCSFKGDEKMEGACCNCATTMGNPGQANKERLLLSSIVSYVNDCQVKPLDFGPFSKVAAVNDILVHS